jgi:hypothetical protein
MLTTIIILVIAFIVILWLKNKSKAQRAKDEKPLWSIGYALYFLTEIFTRGHDNDEALERVVAASRNGMPTLRVILVNSTALQSFNRCLKQSL